MAKLAALKDNINFYLVCLISFAIPLEKRLLPYIIAVYFIHFLFGGGLKEKLQKIKESKYVWITTAYYFFLILGCTYSNEIDAAFFDLEVKFSLLIFPLMLVAQSLSRKQINVTIAWFVAGCFVAFLICLSYAIIFFYTTQDVSMFYYDKLSVFHHPSYFSMYLNFAILALYYYLIFDTEAFEFNSVTMYVILIVIFSLFVVLLSSKLGLISLLLIIFFGTLFWFLKSRAIFPSIMVFTMLTTMIYFSFKYSSIIQERIEEAFVSLSDDKPRYSTTGARLLIWDIALELIMEKPLIGYGTGDVKAELVKQYKERNYLHLYENTLNAHNEYIQMLIAIGLIGTTLFLLYMYFFVFNLPVYNNFLFLGFVCLVSLNFLTESMLETQAGVIFYAFFNSILFFNSERILNFKVIFPLR